MELLKPNEFHNAGTTGGVGFEVASTTPTLEGLTIISTVEAWDRTAGMEATEGLEKGFRG